MPTLVFRFPASRYHATPSGHHVNEGLIEWPPSPWRLLRAFLAIGYTALGWPGNPAEPMHSTPPEDARSLITRLASVLPHYKLPAAAGAHTRHYMPLGRIDKGHEQTTLVFDTFANVKDSELAVSWDVELSTSEMVILNQLTANLNYLGRSESWTIARVAHPDDSAIDGTNCFPCDGKRRIPGWEQITLLAPDPAEYYANWREEAVTEALAPFPLTNPKPTKKLLEQRQKAEAPYPADLLACLQVDTTWLREYGWSQPPGSRRVLYWRRSDALEAGAPKPSRRTIAPSTVEAMLLALATASGNDHALPHVTRALSQAELLHRALVRAASNLAGHSTVISGCDSEGHPLKSGHDHLHILPLDLDEDAHIDHILLWAPMGLDAAAQEAVRTIRKSYTRGGIGPIKVALVGAGSIADLRLLPGLLGDNLRMIVGSSNGAKIWRSCTPFVAPRHIKRRGDNDLESQVKAELASRSMPLSLRVGPISFPEDIRTLILRHFQRTRKHGPAPPIDCGFCLQIEFSTPVPGPLAIGYGSHFGLGLFRALDTSV